MFRAHPPAEFASKPFEEPIRAELFGVERLEQHAESLAAAQRVVGESAKDRRLLPRVEDNGRVLREAYRAITKAIREEHVITHAAEWLVDNFHVVDEQLREIRDDLPLGFYRKLPKLADGPLAGYPRVYGRAARQVADALADDLLGLDGRPVDPTVFERLEGAPLETAFAVQLVQRLRDQDPDVTPALLWLDERLAGQGTTSDDIVRVEHQRQAAMNVTVRNVILSMSLMSAVDWAEFFESVSGVDEVLSADTDFGAMDFATRDAYRHAIEELARGSGRSELDVARAAVGRAG